MRNKDLLKIISIALSFVSFATCLFIWGRVSGFEKGFLYGVFSDPPATGFSGQGGFNFFQNSNTSYLIIALGFFTYIIGKFLKPLVVSSIICILSLSVITYPLFDMLLYKNQLLPISNPNRDVYWQNNKIYFDWFLLFATIILMLIQIILFNTRKMDTEKFKIN